MNLLKIYWLLLAFAITAQAQDSNLRLETGGIEIILPQGWEALNQPTNAFTQQRARNRDTGVAVSAGAFRIGLSLEQYISIGIAAFDLSPEQQIEKASTVTGIPASEIESAMQSQIGRKMLAGMQRAHDTMRFELVDVKKIKISNATAYEALAKLTDLKSGQIIYSRQFTLNGTLPYEIVNIAFVSSSEDVFQDHGLVNAIVPQNKTKTKEVHFFVPENRDSPAMFETNGVQLFLPEGWVTQASKSGVQYRARNPQGNASVNVRTFRVNLELESYVAVFVANVQPAEKDYNKISNLTGLTTDQIEKVLESPLGRQLSQEQQQYFKSMAFALQEAKREQLSGGLAYEIEATTVMDQNSKQITYSRQFILSDALPGELVKVTFVSQTDNIFQDQSLADAIHIK